MNNESIYILAGIMVVIVTVMVWNNRHENIYIPRMAPNQVYQGNYTNPMTGPRDWSCPNGSCGKRCLGSTEPLEQSEGYRHNGMNQSMSGDSIDIITPPLTDEVFALGFGVGPGLFGSGRFTSPMF